MERRSGNDFGNGWTRANVHYGWKADFAAASVRNLLIGFNLKNTCGDHVRLAFTGVQIALSLRENALEAYREFVGKVPVPERLSDSSSWDGGILFVIPTRPFPFPLQRGPADALNGNTREIGKLRPIKSFDFNSVRFFKLQKRSGQSLSYEKTAKLSGDQFGRELHLGVDWKKSWSLWP